MRGLILSSLCAVALFTSAYAIKNVSPNLATDPELTPSWYSSGADEVGSNMDFLCTDTGVQAKYTRGPADVSNDLWPYCEVSWAFDPYLGEEATAIEVQYSCTGGFGFKLVLTEDSTTALSIFGGAYEAPLAASEADTTVKYNLSKGDFKLPQWIVEDETADTTTMDLNKSKVECLSFVPDVADESTGEGTIYIKSVVLWDWAGNAINIGPSQKDILNAKIVPMGNTVRFQLLGSNLANKNYTVSVFTANGKNLLTKNQFFGADGKSELSLKSLNLSNGMYVVKLSNKMMTLSKRINIK